MGIATPQQLAALRGLLDARRGVLIAELQAAEQARGEPAGRAQHEVADRKDEASALVDARLMDAQEQRDRNELAQVDAALQRMAGGSYGDCLDCGEPIAVQRLLVQPAAQRCSPCEAALEKAAARGPVEGGARRP